MPREHTRLGRQRFHLPPGGVIAQPPSSRWWLENTTGGPISEATSTRAWGRIIVTEEAKLRIRTLRDQDLSIRQIAKATGIPRQTVQDVLSTELKKVTCSPFWQMVEF
jgi:hypothetical protein